MTMKSHIDAQKKYCDETGYPHFAPHSGICWSCGEDIYKNMTVKEAGSKHITGCPHCKKSFCD